MSFLGYLEQCNFLNISIHSVIIIRKWHVFFIRPTSNCLHRTLLYRYSSQLKSLSATVTARQPIYLSFTPSRSLSLSRFDSVTPPTQRQPPWPSCGFRQQLVSFLEAASHAPLPPTSLTGDDHLVTMLDRVVSVSAAVVDDAAPVPLLLLRDCAPPRKRVNANDLALTVKC